MNVLCLDIDDCIFPSDSNYLGRTSDSQELLIINLKRIRMIIEKYNMKVFITSSWYSRLTLDKFGQITLKSNKLTIPMRQGSFYKEEELAFASIKYYLDGYIIGLSCGNRNKDIETLLKDDNIVIAFDDMDLSHIKNGNYLYCEVTGFVSNHIGYNINEFFKRIDLNKIRGD